MELVKDWRSLRRETHYEPPIIPLSRFGSIETTCYTKRETASECASYYVHCHPLASWTHLACRLYEWDEFAAVEKLKPNLPLRGKQFFANT